MDKFSGIIAFMRAAEYSSFTKAGAVLGISSSAVGKSIKNLEERMGVRLFHRTTRQISLTAEGAAFFEQCSKPLFDLEEAESSLAEAANAPRGTLKISLPAAGHRLLDCILHKFNQKYPEIDLDIDFNDRIVDIVKEGFDLVIRSGQLRDSNLTAKRLCKFKIMLCASPAYLAEFGTPTCIDHLKSHKCIGYKMISSGKLQVWTLYQGDSVQAVSMKPSLVMNSIEAVMSASTAGQGIAYLPDFVIASHVASKKLVPVLQAFSQPGDFWMLWHSSRRLPLKSRVFIDFLMDAKLNQVAIDMHGVA